MSWREEVIARGWSDALPRQCADIEGIGGRLKEQAQDFVVDEVLAFEPGGGGEHLYLKVRRSEMTTPSCIRVIADALGVRNRDIGYAGLKDKWAVATQWFSVHLQKGFDEACLDELRKAGLEIQEQVWHRHKLRVGKVKANRFRLRLRESSGDGESLGACCERLRGGFPNYFGSQRFGRGDNLSAALAGLRQPRRGRGRGKRFLVSALQSAFFNLVLGVRVEQGLSFLAGDVLQVVRSGGCFISEEAADEQRQQGGEVVATGPLFGPKALIPGGRAGQFEAELMRSFWEAHVPEEELERILEAASQLAAGGRRPIFVQPQELEYELEGNDALVSFELPSGCYATVLMREIMG